MRPKIDVSVVVPSYKDAEWVRRLFAGLSRQTRLPAEVFVVDDGTPVGQGHIPDGDEFVEPHRNLFNIGRGYQEHLGASAARNAGWRAATCEYVFFCDADIDLEPDCLEELHRNMQLGAAGSDVGYCQFDHGPGSKVLGAPFTADALRSGNFIGGVAMIRKPAIPDEGWDEELLRFQDWEFWQRVLIRDRRSWVFVNKILFHAPHRPGGISGGGSISHEEARRIVLEKKARWDVQE